MKDIRYEIFLGLNQKDSGDDLNIAKVSKQIEKFLSNFKINFSLNFQLGGYIHEDGTYVLENGIKMTFVGKRSNKEEQEFFQALKENFKQESVLVIKKEIEAAYK